MSKRRLRREDGSEERAPEELTSEERKAKRRRDRAQARSGKFRKGLGTPARRGILAGGVAAVVIVVVLLVLYNPFGAASPCLTLQPAVTAPYYPKTAANLSNSWCPPGTPTIAYSVAPRLTIVINGSDVPIPPGIGYASSRGGGNASIGNCQLPITTPQANSSTALALPKGVLLINSPWLYSYNLSWFFQEWAATYSTVNTGPGHPSQPVSYTASDLLGYTGAGSIHLFVNNVSSSAGPSLVISTLPFLHQGGSPFPSCIATVYGHGNWIRLVYAPPPSGGAALRPAPAGGSTGWGSAPVAALAGVPGPVPPVAVPTGPAVDGRSPGAAFASLAFAQMAGVRP